MRVQKICILVMVMAALLFVGCATTGDKIIDHPQQAFGGNVPEWVQVVRGSGMNSDLVEMFDGQVVFTTSEKGENLDALEFWVDTFDLNQIVADQLVTTFSTQATQRTDATEDEIERIATAVSEASGKVSFSGLKKEADYWLLFENDEEEKYYEYYVLYVMDRDNYEEQLEFLIDELTPEDKEIVRLSL